MRRRHFVLGGVSAFALMAPPLRAIAAPPDLASRTEDEWRAVLTPGQYVVLRQAQTEQPYSSALTSEKRRGTYMCGGCGQRAFSSSDKYDSKTGWPSFRGPLPRAVREKRDRSQGLDRTEVECLALRLSPGTRVRRWSSAQAAALLHQRRRPEFHPGIERTS